MPHLHLTFIGCDWCSKRACCKQLFQNQTTVPFVMVNWDHVKGEMNGKGSMHLF